MMIIVIITDLLQSGLMITDYDHEDDDIDDDHKDDDDIYDDLQHAVDICANS